MTPALSPRRAVALWAQPVVDAFLGEHGLASIPVLPQRPARPEHGDMAINLAMRLAAELKRPPMEIATDLAARLAPGGPAGAIEVAAPGFINILLDPAWVFGSLPAVVEAGADWGRSDYGDGRRVQVEFVSANPVGPLLFSHGRGAVVGDTAARLLAFTGHAVEREYYINDAGRQVHVFAESLIAARHGKPPPDDGYAADYIQELARQIPEHLLEGDGEAVEEAVLHWGVDHYLAEFREELAAIGIHFDHWFSERNLFGDWEADTISELERAGVLRRHDQATWMVLGDKEDVLYKSNGEPTYLMGDLLYHRDKFVRRGFDVVIDVWGSDHQNQVRRLKQAVQVFGVDPERFVVILIQLVRMKSEGEFVKISKRAGNIILLSDLVSEVGADAVRYHYLLRSSDAPMDFDVDLARSQSNENPVFYAQYAHARLCSVKAVAAEAGLAPDASAVGRLGTPAEVALARELLDFPDVVEEASRELAPHDLPHYGQRLAERIHGFYHAGNQDSTLRVVVDDRELAAARLFLCEAARQTMANLLDLIGVAAPERM
ncbi:MAG TPA: arginine--tRNA ligase [Candidatus Solibacter sp.]|nr:arginine--tRNA ligase [Candidatus Solibacter sp.]